MAVLLFLTSQNWNTLLTDKVTIIDFVEGGSAMVF
jgi:hypothetical protein